MGALLQSWQPLRTIVLVSKAATKQRARLGIAGDMAAGWLQAAAYQVQQRRLADACKTWQCDQPAAEKWQMQHLH